MTIKQCNKIVHLHLIVALSGRWRHNYSTKTRQVGHADEQYIYSLMSTAQSSVSTKATFNMRLELQVKAIS
jgi:hypothetical protein